MCVCVCVGNTTTNTQMESSLLYCACYRQSTVSTLVMEHFWAISHTEAVLRGGFMKHTHTECKREETLRVGGRGRLPSAIRVLILKLPMRSGS